MKKINILALIILFIFVACTNSSNKKTGFKIKKINQKETPIPEFVDIEKYIRPSYQDIDSDEIRRETFIAESPYLDLTLKSLILKGKVRVGMYKEEVFASVGKPHNKIQYPTEFGLKEEWIYEEDILHFENGVLKNIEQIKKQ